MKNEKAIEKLIAGPHYEQVQIGTHGSNFVVKKFPGFYEVHDTSILAMGISMTEKELREFEADIRKYEPKS